MYHWVNTFRFRNLNFSGFLFAKMVCALVLSSTRHCHSIGMSMATTAAGGGGKLHMHTHTLSLSSGTHMEVELPDLNLLNE